VRITAVRKLAVEAADTGLLAPELAAGIARVKSAKPKGRRVGNWLSPQQAQALLNARDVAANKGLRDRAILAVLLGCGLRRSEVASLTLKHIQLRENRWCIVDLVGKHARIRTVPVPTWVKVANRRLDICGPHRQGPGIPLREPHRPSAGREALARVLVNEVRIRNQRPSASRSLTKSILQR